MRSALRALAFVCALAALPAAAAQDAASLLPAESELEPLRRAGDFERFSAETLWERINGEAELYLSYGFTDSAHAAYEDSTDRERRVGLSVFTFSDPLGAFGLFAAFRPPECAPVAPLGNGGCLGDYQGFFWQGSFFVLAEGAGPAATRPADIRRALAAVAARAGAPPERPEPLRAFSRVADTRTIRYQPRHLLGRAALPPGLEGVASGVEVFTSVGACDAEKATAALDAYAGALEGAERSERNGYQVLVGRDPALGPMALLAS